MIYNFLDRFYYTSGTSNPERHERKRKNTVHDFSSGSSKSSSPVNPEKNEQQSTSLPSPTGSKEGSAKEKPDSPKENKKQKEASFSDFCKKHKLDKSMTDEIVHEIVSHNPGCGWKDIAGKPYVIT